MITGFYAGIFGLLLLALSALVIRERYRLRVALGDEDHPSLRRRMRVQANFCEYVPLCLLLIGFGEIAGTIAPWLLHLLLSALLAGRLVHALGMSNDDENLGLRRIGMILTFTVLVVASVLSIVAGVRSG